MLTCVAKHIVKTIKQATKLYIMLLFFAILNVAQASEVKFSQTPTKAEIFLPLSNNVDYEIESRDNIIQLSFSQPLSKDLRETKKNLNLFIKEQDISSDQKSIRLETKLPHTIRTGNENDILHIEIGLPQENNLTSGANGHKIISEYGQHKDYDRISFAYNKKPQYAVKAAQDNTIISFINPVEIDWSKVQNKNIYPYIEQTSNKLGGIDIKFPGKLLKSFEYQNKIVLDFLPKAVINVPQEQYLRSANITQSQNTIANAKDEVQNSINKEKVSSLAFPWNMEVGVSVFQRGKYIWVAFDHSQNIDLADLRRQSKDVAEEIIQLPHSQALILRITPKKNVKVGLRQEGLLWIIDLYTHNIAYKGKELPIFLQYNSMNQSYLYIPSISIGNALSIIDPEIGDVIYIGTETELGLSVNEDYHYPDLEILPAKQGFAIVPNSSDIIVSKGNTGFSIKGNNRGLNISDNLENLKRQQQLWEKTSEVFDLNIPAQILNLDFNKDFRDWSHINLYGSRKVMDHLIPYIIEHYNIPNRKNDPAYASWNEDYIKYARAINREEIRELKSFTDWKKQAFYDNYTVMLSANGDVLRKLPDTLKNDLKSFGLKKYDTNKANMRYAAIIDDNKVFFEEISNKPVTYKGRMKNIVNLLVSSDGKATINVSGKPRSKNKYGLNFVIYDKVNREIVDSIWIDPRKPDAVRR